MTSPIEYLQSHGFRITSNPSEYRESYPDGKRSPWGYRNYVENGIHHDSFCDGWHRAFDLSDKEGADLPAVVDGTIVSGTKQNGNFGGTVVLADHKGDYQYIYGHCKNLQVKVGDEVKQGDKLAEQSNTNYYNNPMQSHLHFQTQEQEYYAEEKAFVCTGVDPTQIDVSFYVENQKGSDTMASYKIVNMWVASSKYRIKAPYAMTPNTITIHNTANTAAARNEVSYMRGNNNMTSFHAAIDDKEVVQALPFNRNAFAAGDGANGPGNRRSIHLEICYSMDNGYSGRYSPRHAQAEKNAALYVAHVLHEKGWGLDRLKQHYDWSRKDCPHKMRAWNNWNAFKSMVQGYMNDIRGGKSPGSSKSSTSKPKPSSSGSYTVKKNDTLWGIANVNNMTVKQLKDINNLKSNTIRVGQTLKLSGKSSSSSSSGSGTGGAGNIKYKWDEWRKNQYNTYYVAVDATFVVGDTGIWPYENGPFVRRANRAPSIVKPGTTVEFYELRRQDGYVWGTYKTGSGRERDLPIKEWNGGGGRVTNSGLYGRFI